MRPIIVGTAGHVDHGKTTLIKALTGKDTDRLPEEKTRGISIDLGFAAFRLPDGRVAGVVDVPGHERFIKNMLAGVAGMDVVLLVIAADEGVMPQTREHLDILSLAGIRKGIIVLNKVDLVDREWLEIVTADVRDAVKGTPFADAPLVAVSAVTGEGLEELPQAIVQAAADAAVEVASPFLRLPVDRVFAVKGHGTVVTGTLLGGTVAPGDVVEIVPSPGRLTARVRRVEVHDEQVSAAVSGQRVALNLVGVEAAAVRRGQVVTAPDTIASTNVVDVRLRLLPGAWQSLTHRARVRAHLGTAEVLGRVSLLEGEELAPGEEAYAQLFLEEPAVCLIGDRLVIRSYSPAHTVGGGVVLNAHPPKRKRFRSETLQELALEDRGEAWDVVFLELRKGRADGPSNASGLTRVLGMPQDSVSRALETLTQQKKALRLPSTSASTSAAAGGTEAWYFACQDADERVTQAIREVSRFHEENTLENGISREELRTRLFGRWNQDAYGSFVAWLVKKGRLESREGGTLALPGFAVRLSDEEENSAGRIEEFYLQAGVAPSNPDEVATSLAMPRERHDRLAALLARRGRLVKAPGGLLFHRGAVEEARRHAGNRLAQGKPLSAGEFRDAIGASRRHAIALLELFDEEKFTRRVGDVRTAGPRFNEAGREG